MKKILLFLMATLLVGITQAQSTKYVQAMKQNIAQLDTMVVVGNEATLANNFTRIGDAEKDQWLPYYYAAYATVMQALTAQDKGNNDGIADKANELLNKAAKILGTDNSEIEVIRSMIATAHLVVDPQSRFMSYGQESNEHLKKAIDLDSTNPRPILLKAQSTFYTPESFGGGKEAAKPLFEKAQKMFASFKPSGELMPVWGEGSVQYFLSMYK